MSKATAYFKQKKMRIQVVLKLKPHFCCFYREYVAILSASPDQGDVPGLSLGSNEVPTAPSMPPSSQGQLPSRQPLTASSANVLFIKFSTFRAEILLPSVLLGLCSWLCIFRFQKCHPQLLGAHVSTVRNKPYGPLVNNTGLKWTPCSPDGVNYSLSPPKMMAGCLLLAFIFIAS